MAVRFDALGDKAQTARVTEVGVGSTGMATTFPVTVLLDRSRSGRRPGMAAEVELPLRSAGAASGCSCRPSRSARTGKDVSSGL